MAMPLRAALAALATTVLLAFSAPDARGEEGYLALIFGSQDHPKQLRYSHTWATFVRAVGEGPDISRYALEEVTISWLPATLKVRVWARDPEPGVNLGLYETIRYVQSKGERVTAWGPFVVGPDLYQRALAKAAQLNGGGVRYRAISSGQDLEFSDCIHAVADVDPVFGRGHYPLLRVGVPASRYVAKNIKSRSRFDQELSDHSWLVGRMGLVPLGVKIVSAPDAPALLFPTPR